MAEVPEFFEYLAREGSGATLYPFSYDSKDKVFLIADKSLPLEDVYKRQIKTEFYRDRNTRNHLIFFVVRWSYNNSRVGCYQRHTLQSKPSFSTIWILRLRCGWII